MVAGASSHTIVMSLWKPLSHRFVTRSAYAPGSTISAGGLVGPTVARRTDGSKYSPLSQPRNTCTCVVSTDSSLLAFRLNDAGRPNSAKTSRCEYDLPGHSSVTFVSNTGSGLLSSVTSKVTRWPPPSHAWGPSGSRLMTKSSSKVLGGQPGMGSSCVPGSSAIKGSLSAPMKRRMRGDWTGERGANSGISTWQFLLTTVPSIDSASSGSSG
mmetsp:Transcript_22555/g.55608  ORF Transcript_22555/g.55608 Transcript_22555/m.55608 type:complete len:212 (-) Transcript_22555:98-733(-)